MNLILTDALAVAYEEGFEVGLVMSTMERNNETPLNIARKLLIMGQSAGAVQEYTGVDMEILMQLTDNRWHLPVRRIEAITQDMERETEKVCKEYKANIARNLLAEGFSYDFIQKITGLDIDTLKGLQG